MQRVDLEAEIREKSGKGMARQIRRSGKIPGVLYGGGKATPLVLNPADLTKILQSESGENTLINLKLKGTKPASGEKAATTAILRDFQRDPISNTILHADLFEISMTKAIRIRVPIEVTGEVPAGVKEGGVLQYNLRELEIECLPTMIPDHVPVNASHLKMGEAIHVKDLQAIEGIKVLEDPEMTVVSVAVPISEAKLEEILAGAPAAAEVKEPELVGKEKKAEEEEAAAAAEAKPGEKPEAKAQAAPAEKVEKPEGKGKKQESK
jgi:large subunit ribosomal protein L25